MIRMNEQSLWEMQRTLSAEFSKYVLIHPEMNKLIPDNALIIFQIKDNPDFNNWSKKTGMAQREGGQPVIFVKIDALAPPLESRLINPHVESVFK